MLTKAYHSGLKPAERSQVQEDWMDGVFPVMCATIGFGMGVDKSSVRFVIHWDVPQSVAGYYQESGRAGRDGKPSYCRLYYCRKAVSSIEFLLKADISKAKEERKEHAMRSFRDFQQVCTYCETVQCRHRLFSNYFGDEPPGCKQMCDVCKDRTAAEKSLEAFNKLSMNFYTGGRISTEDGSDLYEGGRAALNAPADQDGSGDEYGESSSSAKAKEATALLIQRQFALRKVAAAKEAEMHPTAQLTRVRAAMSTAVKVSGLTNTIRESYLKMMADLMKTNYETCGHDDPTEHRLIYADFEDIAVDIEYECFSRNKVLSLYRRSCAVEGNKLKKFTLDGKTIDQLKSHQPRQRKTLGGDLKQFEKQVAELDAKINNVAGRKRGASFRKETMTQTTLGSFFKKGSPSVVPIETEAIDSEEELSTTERRMSFDDIESDESSTVALNGNSLIKPTTHRKDVSVELASDSTHKNKIIDQLKLADLSKLHTGEAPSSMNTEIDENEKNRLENEANRKKNKRMEEKMRRHKSSKSSSSRHHKDKRHKHKRERSRSRERSSKNDRRSRSPKRAKREPKQSSSGNDKSKPPSSDTNSLKSEHSANNHFKHHVKSEPLSPNKVVINPLDLLSDVKLETRGPVSPTPTVIKPELRSNSRERDFDDLSDSDIFSVIPTETNIVMDIKFEEIRSTSPTSTIIKQEPRSNSRDRDFDEISDKSDLFPATPTPGSVIATATPKVIKKEPRSNSQEKDFDQISDNSEVFPDTPTQMNLNNSSPIPTIIKQEPKSNSRDREFDQISDNSDLFSAAPTADNPTSTIIKTEPRSNSQDSDFDQFSDTSEMSPKIPTRMNANKSSPTTTIIKQEPRSNSQDRDFDKISDTSEILSITNNQTTVGIVKLERSLSMSPTSTIVKQEPRSTSRDRDFDDEMMNATIKREKNTLNGHSFIVKKEINRSVSPADTIVNHDIRRSSSRELDFDNDPKAIKQENSQHKRRQTKEENDRLRRYDHKSQSHSKHSSRHRSRRRSISIDSNAPSTSSSTIRKERSNRHKESKHRHRSRSKSPEDRHRSHRHKGSKHHHRSRSNKDRKSRHTHQPSPLRKKPKIEPASERSSSEKDADPFTIVDEILSSVIPNQPTQPVLNIEDPLDFQEITDAAVDRIIAEKKRRLAQVQLQIEAKTREKIAELDTKIIVEAAHVKSQQDDFYEQLLGTDNLDSWDDDDALSNVEVAQMLRKQRHLLEEKRRSTGQPAKTRRSITDQLFVTELDELIKPEPSVEIRSIVAEETDYTNMDLSGRLLELEQRFVNKKMPVMLGKRIKEEKKRISEMVIKSMMPYYNADRIQPRFLFNGIARHISHRFYAQRSEESQIRDHVDRIFVQFPCITSLDDIKYSAFL